MTVHCVAAAEREIGRQGPRSASPLSPRLSCLVGYRGARSKLRNVPLITWGCRQVSKRDRMCWLEKNSSLCCEIRPELGGGRLLACSVGRMRSLLLEGTALSEIEPPLELGEWLCYERHCRGASWVAVEPRLHQRCFIDGTTMVANRWQMGGPILTDLVELYLAAHR